MQCIYSLYFWISFCCCSPYMLIREQDNKLKKIGIMAIILNLCIILSFVFYLFLLYNSFWIAGLTSQINRCELYLLKNVAQCGYWIMVLEVSIWITIAYTPLIICNLLLILITIILQLIVFFVALFINLSHSIVSN